MDGIYEEAPASLTFDDWADEIMLHTPRFDVVYAVQTGRDLIGQQECDCLTASDYTTDDDLHGSAAMLYYAAALSLIIVAFASAAAVLILASGWTL